MTVVVLFSRLDISSSVLQLRMISVNRSTLFRRQASTSCSFTDAPWRDVSYHLSAVKWTDAAFDDDVPRKHPPCQDDVGSFQTVCLGRLL